MKNYSVRVLIATLQDCLSDGLDALSETELLGIFEIEADNARMLEALERGKRTTAFIFNGNGLWADFSESDRMKACSGARAVIDAISSEESDK